jgi:hypothetical protein
MTPPITAARLSPYPIPASLRPPTCPLDIHAALSEALGTEWTVQREIDPDGEVSILAMAADDADNTRPTFLLYERYGLAQVVSVRDDAWQSLGGYATAQAGVATIITAIARLPHSPSATI